jgi:DNA polymerase-3 subunit delta
VSQEQSPLRPVYIIAGGDRPKVRRAVERLRQRVVRESGSDLNVVGFDAGTTPPEEVVAAAETPSFALGRRLVLVHDAHLWKAEQRKAILAYAADPMPDTTLALIADTWSDKDPIAKTLRPRETLLLYDVPKKAELDGWIAGRARAHGLRLSVAARRRLGALVGWPERRDERAGEHMEIIEREIEKLAAFAGDGELGEEDVERVVSPTVEARVFELTDAMGRRDRSRAFALLEQLYAGGEDPNRALYTLLRHVRLLAALHELGGRGRLDRGQVAKELGVHPFTAQKLLEQRRAFGRAQVRRATIALAEAEAGLRGRGPAALESEGGVDRGAQLVLELALARMLDED